MKTYPAKALQRLSIKFRIQQLASRIPVGHVMLVGDIAEELQVPKSTVSTCLANHGMGVIVVDPNTNLRVLALERAKPS